MAMMEARLRSVFYVSLIRESDVCWRMLFSGRLVMLGHVSTDPSTAW